MIRIKDIPFVRANYGVGQKIKCNKFSGGEKQIRVEATIIGKYPYFALVTDNGRDKWCIQWIDFIIQGIQ